MPDFDEMSARLDDIEASTNQRPGAAQAELEALLPRIGEVIVERQGEAVQLLRNEDFAGAAQVLVENALLLQRGAGTVLTLREQVRRRR